LLILETAIAPSRSNPLGAVSVTDHLADAILPQQRGVLFGHFLRIELANSAAANVSDETITGFVTDGDGVAIAANATARIGEGSI
jgi:hypothetical protein